MRSNSDGMHRQDPVLSARNVSERLASKAYEAKCSIRSPVVTLWLSGKSRKAEEML